MAAFKRFRGLLDLQKILHADNAGAEMRQLYEITHIALAGLVPVGVLAAEGLSGRFVDVGLTAAVPIHSHIAMNGIISDYVPPSIRLPARYAMVGVSTVTFLGMLKMTLMGPGICDSVKKLWKSSDRK